MVALKNITKTNNSISADYYPEGKGPRGYMELSLADGEIIEHKNVSDFSAVHVIYELQRLSRMENPPVKKTIIWY